LGSAAPTETIVTRAMWVGTSGESKAIDSGASLMIPSQAALSAARAGDYSLMTSESVRWAAGATGDVPVFFGNGAGTTFLRGELPQLMKQLESGKVSKIKITF
jgi:hypothetical protein